MFKEFNNGFGKDFKEELEVALDQLNTNTNIVNQTLHTEKTRLDDRIDTIVSESGNSNTEIVDARGNEATLKGRLDKMEKNIDTLGVYVDEFGAIGDGITDDGQNIKLAHQEAAALKLPVIYGADKTYYLSGVSSIPVQTDMDLNGSTVIINDAVQSGNHVYTATNDEPSITFDATQLAAVQTSFKKTTLNVPQLAGYGTAFVYIEDSNVINFIREGGNANDGYSQRDFFMVNNDGDILNEITWDFNAITLLTVYPVSDKVVKVKNGTFISKGNSTGDTYINRGFNITRSNFHVENVSHLIESNVPEMSPAGGFFSVRNCGNVKFSKVKLTPRRYHQNSSGVNIGTYELNMNIAAGIILEDVEGYANSSNYWGCVGNESLKDVTLIRCKLNRFDAHRGVHNLRLDGCTIGHHGMTLTGYGELLVENSKFYCNNMLSMRADYGSFWNGDVKLLNVDHYPKTAYRLFSVSPQLNHDFGYPLMFGDRSVIVENYTVHPETLTSLTTLPLMTFSFTMTDIPTIQDFKIADKFIFKNCKTSNGKGFTLFDYDNYHHIRAKKNMVYQLNTFTLANVIDQTIESNVDIECENVEFTKYAATESATAKSSIVNDAGTYGADYTQPFEEIPNRLLPNITLKNCGEVSATVWSLPAILRVEGCKIVRFNNQLGGGSKSQISVKDSQFQIYVPNNALTNVARANSLKSFFENVQFQPPKLPDNTVITTTPHFTNLYEILKFTGTNQMVLRGNLSNCTLDTRIPLATLKADWADYGWDFGTNRAEEIIFRKRGTTAQIPTGAIKPTSLYYDTTLSKTKLYTGSSWVQIQA